MKKQDTVRLLRECDAGVKMGVAAINEVLPYAAGESLRTYLQDCRNGHERLGLEIEKQLAIYEESGKNPNLLAQGMAWMKTNMKLAMNESEQTVAELMTDGCNMGVKSLSRYLNQYRLADEKSRDITRNLIDQEEKLAYNMRKFL